MKKLLSLALAGVCALAFAASIDAATVNRIKVTNRVTSNTNSYTGGTSSVYANHATGSGVAAGWDIKYVYSNDLLNTNEVYQKLKNALGNPYSGMVPSVANETGSTTLAVSTYGTPDANWKDVSYVATNIIPGRCASLTSGGNAGAVDSGAVADMHEDGKAEAERQAKEEAAHRAAWEKAEAEKKAIWDEDQKAMAEADPEYVPQEYVGEEYVPLDFGETKVDNQKVLANNQFETIVGVNLNKTFSYKFEDGKIVKVNDVDITNVMHVTTIYSASANKFVSPLVLDLKGDGVLQASEGQHMPGHAAVQTNLVAADFYGDGFEIGMEWVGPQDGLLVAPKADGSVDISCLFGTAGGYETGYEKLSLYDANNDGIVSGSELAGLSVWQDANGNAKAEAGELKTVQELGISSITLSSSADFISSFEMNGETHKMWDWWPNAVELVKVSAR